MFRRPRESAFLRISFLLALCLLYISAPQLFAASSVDSLLYTKGTFFGNANNDAYLLGVTVDKQGYVYGTGLGTSIPATAGAYQTSLAGQYDVFVFKMDPDLRRLVWATYIGGNANDGGGSIKVNDRGEVFISGYTFSTNFPISNQNDQSYLSGAVPNVFVLKLTADGGQLLYSRVLGRASTITQQTAGASKGASVAINPADEAFVFAHSPTNSPYSITNNAYQQTARGQNELVFTKLDATGNVVYSTYIGGAQNEVAGNICYAKGTIYLTGTTASSDFPIQSGKTIDVGDCFLMSIADALSPQLLRAVIYGSSSSDLGLSVAYDFEFDRVCVTGTTAAADMQNIQPIVSGNQTYGGFVARTSSTLGAFDFVTSLGPGTVPTGLAVRKNGGIFIAGYCTGAVPVTPNALQTSKPGGQDGFLVSIDFSGAVLRYGTFIGGSSSDYAIANVNYFEEDSCKFRVVFGITTHSQNFPTTRDSYQPDKLNGSEDQPAIVMFTSPSAPPPRLSQSAKPCAQYRFDFLSNSCYVPLSLQWYFDDGSPPIPDSSSVTHKFKRNGDYTMRLIVVYPGPDTQYFERKVSIRDYPLITAAPSVSYRCAGDSGAVLRAYGGVRYSWTPSIGLSDTTSEVVLARPDKNTTYYVHGWDANGCEGFDSLYVTILKINPRSSGDTLICEGQSVKISASGGGEISWKPATGLTKTTGFSVVATPKLSTEYTALIKDGPCIDSAKLKITVVHAPRLTMPASPTICPGSSLVLNALVTALNSIDTAGLSYTWSPAGSVSDVHSSQPTATPSKTSLFRVTVTNIYGCTASDSILVKVDKKLSITHSADTNLCTGAVLQLYANGALKYRWIPGEGLDDSTASKPICHPQKDMTYTIIAESGSCADTQRVHIKLYNIPQVTAVGDTSVCTNEEVRLRVRNPDSLLYYEWVSEDGTEHYSGSTIQFKAIKSSNYIVVASNGRGCYSYDTAHVDTDNALQVGARGDTAVCPGSVAVLHIQGGRDSAVDYQWLPAGGVFDKRSGDYAVNVTGRIKYTLLAERGSCNGVDSVWVDTLETPAFTLKADSAVCMGTSAVLSAVSTQKGIHYHWIRNSSSDSMVVDAQASSSATKQLSVRTQFIVEAELNGCLRRDSISVNVLELPVVVLPAAPRICPGESTSINIPRTNLRSIRWEPASGLSSASDFDVIASPDSTTLYSLQVEDVNGCSSGTEIQVFVRERTEAELSITPQIVAVAGENDTITIRARASRDVTTMLRFDVVLDESIFIPSDNSLQITHSGAKQYIHYTFPNIHLGNSPLTVASIPGQVMVTAKGYSVLSIENLEVADTLCPLLHSTQGSLSTQGCFNDGRAVTLIEPIVVKLRSQPAGTQAQLRIETSERGTVLLQLIDVLGVETAHWIVAHCGGASDIDLPLHGIPDGYYTLMCSTSLSRVILNIRKME